MSKLYNQNDLMLLKKKKDINKCAFIVLICLAVISLVIFVLFATYQTRKILSVISSISSTFLVLFAIYFISRFSFYRHIYNEYSTLLETETKDHYLTFVDISISPITLQDKSKVYEVKFANKLGNQIFYLSYIFDTSIFEVNHCYKIQTAYDYIVGYQDEN